MSILNTLGQKVHNLRQQLQPSPLYFAEPGLYHYVRQDEDEHSRLHLRIDEDGSGFLLVNANRVVHLNPTAAQMTYLALEKAPPVQAAKCLQSRFQVSKKQALNDYLLIHEQIEQLIRPDGACPLHDLDLEINAPFSARPSAPYRMDLALTYRCNNDCSHCYNARPRSHPELDTSQWKQVLDRLWELGIPHIVFTGGEPTLRADLPELIAYAQNNGQITGINTNGRRLSDPAYVQQLVDAGLDHVQITLESHIPEIHDAMVACNGAWKQTVAGVRNAVQSKLYIMTNTTMLEANSPHMAKTLDFLAELGVPTIGLNALIYAGHGATVGTGLRESELPVLLELARRKTELNAQRLIWYTPTQYCNFDPMQLELGVKGCTAALYNMCIEPDGSVLPCQSYYHSLGNFLESDWEEIWNHDLCISLRERTYVQDKCHGCLLLPECGGGCPLATKFVSIA
jgi:radical SAM protein with 4Fe4S-binding SPASM domain